MPAVNYAGGYPGVWVARKTEVSPVSMDKRWGDRYREKAVIQMLCELLGYDEGRMYYLLLTVQDTKLDHEFSRSKRYRVTNALFKAGMMGKVKYVDKNAFQYVVLPASILHLISTDSDLIVFLEKLYVRHYSHLFSKTFSQWMLKDERGLIIFMLKYIMRDHAHLVSDDSHAFDTAGVDTSKITLKRAVNGVRRKFGIIDGSTAFDFSLFAEHDSHAAIGYIARAIPDKESCKVSLIERELAEF